MEFYVMDIHRSNIFLDFCMSNFEQGIFNQGLALRMGLSQQEVQQYFTTFNFMQGMNSSASLNVNRLSESLPTNSNIQMPLSTPLGLYPQPYYFFCSPSPATQLPNTNLLRPLSIPPQKEKVVKKKNEKKEIQSAKKNSESNIVNHFFSFFSSRQKSQTLVEKSAGQIKQNPNEREKLIHLFYSTINSMISRKGREYVNRKNLLDIISPEKIIERVPQIKNKLTIIEGITIEQLCKMFRKCCNQFLRKYSIDSILTSKRIRLIAKVQHLKKRRKIMKALENH